MPKEIFKGTYQSASKETTKSNGAGTTKRNAKGSEGSGANRKSRVIKLAESAPEVKEQSAGSAIAPDDIVFALDIGTRTVVGVVGVQEDECFRVLATEVCEHKNRAMLDGQVHDIEQVAAIAGNVKNKLEARLGFPLKRVAIAAAGRVLKTCKVRMDKKLEQDREIDPELVSSLEIEGIQRAQMILDEDVSDEDKTQYYCVGYSVINYYLNGFIISKLTGHKGKNAGADILATFLPLIVVDSLYTVMKKIGLEVSSLTLEPIAAINVTIPPDLRLLNLALVDIGAGTSDIALTKDGSVIGYAMVPQAGDEITEEICQHYLVDFNTGEKIKTALSSNKDSITFTDILKTKHSITKAEVFEVIEGPMQMLAATISQKILEYNHKAPNAVFLIGGGSRINGFSEMLAKQLKLPADRVVVRGRDVIRDIRFNDKKLYGPESITPYGIAVTAQMYSGKDFLSVTVNDRKMKMFNSKKLTVADALILFGFDAAKLIGRTGKGISFSVNGDMRQVRGGYGKAAEISVNGRAAALDTSIVYGDNITVVPSQDGKDACVKAYELVSSYKNGVVRLNGNPVDISTIVTINGRQASKDTQINNNDQVQISCISTLKKLLEAGGFDSRLCEIFVNDISINDIDYILNDGDKVTCSDKKCASQHQPDIAESEAEDVVTVTADKAEEQVSQTEANAVVIPFETDVSVPAAASEGKTETKVKQSAAEEINSKAVKVNVNGREIVLNDNRTQYIFVDIFNYIEFDLTKPQGNIVLKLNGKQASFTDVIRYGDDIEIYWNK